ncbi:MAG TPA: hypothetical protein VFQ65_11550, partial [Kofleriaceae bacterium]|nr:hypothetical protein [Kofleriaceae bacterium]
MSKETSISPTKPETRLNPNGVLPGVAHLALDVVDRSQSTAIAVLQDARAELRVVFDHSIELAEKSAASLFRFARKLGQRVDEGVAETLGNTERLISGAVKSARETTKAAAELAHTA